MANNNSNLERDYAKQRKRVTQFVKNAQKRGYNFPENIIPDKPKNITQSSINRLAKLTPEKLYKKSTASVKFYDKNGQAYFKEMSGTEARKLERQRAGRTGYLNHIEARNAGFNSVSELRKLSTKLVRQSEKQAQKSENKIRNAHERKIAQYSEWITDELAQQFGYESAEDMLNSPSGMKQADVINQTIRREVRKVHKEKQEQEKQQTEAEQEETKQTADNMTESDKEFAKQKAEQDENDILNADLLQEQEMMWDKIQYDMGLFSSALGTRTLNSIFSDATRKYGEGIVANTLGRLMESDEKLVEQLEALMFYNPASESAEAGKAYAAISKLLWSVGNNEPDDADRLIGEVLDTLEVFEPVK